MMRNKCALFSFKKLSTLLLVLACSACSSEQAGLNELRRLCEKDAGLTIYKTVEADGFYDTRGSNTSVAETDYRFIEFCDDNPTVIDSPGCWRVSKVKRELGQCYERLDKSLAKIVVAPYPEFLKEHCLAVEKLEQPEAEYTYEVERAEWWVNENAGTKMIRHIGRVFNKKTGEVLGQGISYVLRKKSSAPSTFSCGSPQITGLQKSVPFAAGLIEKTLRGTSKITGEVK